MNFDEDDPIAVFVSECAPGWEWQAFSIDRETPETVYYGRVRSPLTGGRWEWGTFSQSDLDTADAQEIER
ncbi:MAG TPA: hypothetical protein VFJ06_14205 [Halococcus sp.]|nr:hypothetical protein [Halococcus sp.]